MTNLTVSDLTTIAEQTLLTEAGVNNWAWYDEAMENYTASPVPVEDALSFIVALDAGGVDNWDGYSDALEGLDEYVEYLNELDANGELATAVSI